MEESFLENDSLPLSATQLACALRPHETVASQAQAQRALGSVAEALTRLAVPEVWRSLGLDKASSSSASHLSVAAAQALAESSAFEKALVPVNRLTWPVGRAASRDTRRFGIRRWNSGKCV